MEYGELARRIIIDGDFTSEEWEAFWRHANDTSVPADERLEILRPMVITDWESVMARAQDAYETALLDLPDEDPRVSEFYDLFEVGKDGLCECQRRSHAS